MKITIFAALIFCVTLVCASAEEIQVPCAQFNKDTGGEINCEGVPIVRIDSQEYERLKALYEYKKSGREEVAPWDDPDAPEAKKPQAQTK